MRAIAGLFGIVALLPAALLPGMAQARMLSVRLCSGAGVGQTVSIPIAPGEPSRGGGDPCCVKGCHAGGSRKRSSCHN
jgi:hypothetical protein